MTMNEMTDLLGMYQLARRRNRGLELKIRELQSEIYMAMGGGIKDVVVEGGTKISRADQIAELVDYQEKYKKIMVKLEKICVRTRDLILKLYTNNDAKDKFDSGFIFKRVKYENLLLEYYVNGSSIKKICDEYGYSYDWLKHILHNARAELYLIYKNKSYDDALAEITA